MSKLGYVRMLAGQPHGPPQITSHEFNLFLWFFFLWLVSAIWMQDRKRQKVGFSQGWILIGKREKENCECIQGGDYNDVS